MATTKTARKAPLIHIEKDRSWCHGTERWEVFAFCGASQECSGSGKHGMVGKATCPECIRLEKQFDEDEFNPMDMV